MEKSHSNGPLTLYIKGAPERVLAKCSTFVRNGEQLPVTEEFRKEYDDAYDVIHIPFSHNSLSKFLQYMASRGHRVIACAQLLLPGDDYPADHTFSRTDDQYPTSEYCFVGLISLEDPPKHGVREAIGTLRLAGIKVMMVTGASL